MPVKFVCLDDYESKRTNWLWEDRIPFGALTIVEGDPGVNKSTLTYDIGARLSIGRPMPLSDKTQPQLPVLFLQGEEPLDRIKAKLISAGAEMRKVFALDRNSAIDSPIVFPDCLEELEEQIAKTGARLVVIDPITAFFQGALGNDQSVRQILTPLANFAEKWEIAIVLVRHLTKNTYASPLYRGAGSMGIMGAARSALLVAKDPTHPEQRVMIQTKSSWGQIADGLAFDLVKDQSDIRIEWLGTTPHTAEEVMEATRSAHSELDEAMYFLYSVLGEGPLPATQVMSLASQAGISRKTLHRAKAALKIDSKRAGFGRGGRFYWRLPDDRRLLNSFQQRDVDELAERLCHGPTDVDLADKKQQKLSPPQSFDEYDPADWWKWNRPDDDEGPGSGNPLGP